MCYHGVEEEASCGLVELWDELLDVSMVVIHVPPRLSNTVCACVWGVGLSNTVCVGGGGVM